MPQIQEYLPEVQTPELEGSVSPNLELAGAVGRAVGHIGEAVEESGINLRRRTAQEETADNYANFAEQRAYWIDRVHQQTQDGTLNVDQISQEYSDATDPMLDQFSTPEGKNDFTRKQARLKGQILQTATAGAAVMAANKARGSWQRAVNANSSSLESDPTQFQDVYEDGVESVDQLINSGGLPESYRDKAINGMAAEYSKAALRGYANQNPAQAQHMLDSGGFDQYLDSDQKYQMQAEINHYANAKRIDQARADKATQDAKDAAYDSWANDNVGKLMNNQLSTKDVMNAQKSGILDWQDAVKWNNMIKESAKQELKTDPRTKNALIQRIVDPNSTSPINEVDDIMPYVGKGISISDFNQLNSLLKKTPEQQSVSQSEKALFDSARKTIRFKNALSNQYDLLGEQKLAQFMSDYGQAKKDVVQNGGKVSDLLDPNNGLYFGNKIGQYQTSMQDQLNHQADDRTTKALGLRPTSQNPNPTPVKGARKPGESAADFLKRSGLGG